MIVTTNGANFYGDGGDDDGYDYCTNRIIK